jgi:hypothetical protein
VEIREERIKLMYTSLQKAKPCIGPRSMQIQLKNNAILGIWGHGKSGDGWLPFLGIVVYPTTTTTGKYTRNRKNFQTRVGLL